MQNPLVTCLLLGVYPVGWLLEGRMEFGGVPCDSICGKYPATDLGPSAASCMSLEVTQRVSAMASFFGLKTV